MSIQPNIKAIAIVALLAAWPVAARAREFGANLEDQVQPNDTLNIPSRFF